MLERKYSKQIFFDKFTFEVNALMGTNLFKLNKKDLEEIYRRVYSVINLATQRGFEFLDPEKVISPFSTDALNRYDTEDVEGVHNSSTSPFHMDSPVRQESTMLQDVR